MARSATTRQYLTTIPSTELQASDLLLSFRRLADRGQSERTGEPHLSVKAFRNEFEPQYTSRVGLPYPVFRILSPFQEWSTKRQLSVPGPVTKPLYERYHPHVLFWPEPEISITGTAKEKSHATALRAIMQAVNSVRLNISTESCHTDLLSAPRIVQVIRQLSETMRPLTVLTSPKSSLSFERGFGPNMISTRIAPSPRICDDPARPN
jgi:hypothetical protein